MPVFGDVRSITDVRDWFVAARKVVQKIVSGGGDSGYRVDRPAHAGDRTQTPPGTFSSYRLSGLWSDELHEPVSADVV